MTTADAPDLIWCDIHEMHNCDHLRPAPRRDPARFDTAMVRISPRGIAHFDGCSHKGDDPDYSKWAEVRAPGAWAAIGNGDITTATRADGTTMPVTSRCLDCGRDGPVV